MFPSTVRNEVPRLAKAWPNAFSGVVNRPEAKPIDWKASGLVDVLLLEKRGSLTRTRVGVTPTESEPVPVWVKFPFW